MRVKLTRAALISLSALLLVSGLTSAQHIYNEGVKNKVDKDGDGYVRSFELSWAAGTYINDVGKPFKPNALQNKGEPKFAISIVEDGDHFVSSLGVYQKGFDTNFYSEKISLKKLKSDNLDSAYQRLHTGKKISALAFLYYESDSNSWDTSSKDEKLDQTTVFFKNPIRLEPASQDKKAQVKITSNVDAASVSINGDYKGGTPYTTRMPVDVAEREGRKSITVSKQGYESESKSLRLNPPQTINFKLDKIKKPLGVSSEPSGAKIKIYKYITEDGQFTDRVYDETQATTPFNRNYWIGNQLKVLVTHNDTTKTYEHVTPGTTVHADFTGSDSSSGSYDWGMGYTMPDFNQISYTLNQLPEIGNFLVGNFTFSPKTLESGDTVHFDASPSYSFWGNITNYRWNMGDGTSKNGISVKHTYKSPGTYNVKLELENAAGNTTTITKSVKVNNAVPVAKFSMSDPTPVTGESVSFTASASSDYDGNIVSYDWQFGSGTSANGEQISHNFQNSGTYTVTLEVEDDKGEVTTVSKQVKVDEPNQAPNARISLSPANPKVGDTVNLNGASSNDPDGKIQKFEWQMGDGYSYSGESATHTYNKSGEYTVLLSVRDSRGETATAEKTVQITGDGSTGESGEEQTSEEENQTGETSEESRGGVVKAFVNLVCAVFGC